MNNQRRNIQNKLKNNHFSSLLTKLAASKQEAKKVNGGQANSDTFKLYINPATVSNSSTSALQVKICLFILKKNNF